MTAEAVLSSSPPGCGGGTAHLLTRDGVPLDVEVPQGSSVVEAAAQAGHTLPSLCGNGTCGACHAVVRHGEYTMDEHDSRALPQRHGVPVPGGVLLCRTHPVGEVDIDLPYERSHIIDGGIPARGASIVSLEPVARSTVKVVLQLDPDPVLGAGLDFQPGQFLEVELPGQDVRRAYSLANTANWDGVAELLIRLREGGAFSTWLATQAAVGDRVVVHGPQGAFGLRENGLRPRWFVAGGTGIAPLLSMVRRMAEWADPQPVRFFLGVGESADILALDELREAGAALSSFVLDVCVWHPDAECSDVVGPADAQPVAGTPAPRIPAQGTPLAGTPVDALAAALAVGGAHPDLYVCGPPAMVDAAADAARAAGVGEEQIIVERYLAC